MQRPEPQTLHPLGDIETRDGIRAAFGRLADFLRRFFEHDYRFKQDVWNELTPLYGELDYSPGGALGDGAQTTVDVTVTGAIPGYCVDASYDQDLQGLQLTAYVRTTNSVRVILQNHTGGGVTVADGRFRIYVKPRLLTS